MKDDGGLASEMSYRDVIVAIAAPLIWPHLPSISAAATQPRYVSSIHSSGSATRTWDEQASKAVRLAGLLADVIVDAQRPLEQPE